MAVEADEVLSLTLQSVDGSSLPAWSPGAHIDVRLDSELSAQYSLCGTLSMPVWRIAVLLKNDGKGVSKAIHSKVRPGDLISVSDPRNAFPLVEAASYLFLAGGIGITPFLPMIERLHASGKQWRLAYGGATRRSMAFIDHLRCFDSDQVSIYPQDETGLVPVANLLQEISSDTAVYCCGPDGLITAVENDCVRFGHSQPHIERFTPKARSLGETNVPFYVTQAQSGRRSLVGADESIADVLEREGVFIPTSCKEGVCGSCETRVIEGEVEHRDSILTDAERRENKTMMVCVSRAKGGHLVLDV
jgi:ferredoxin-NADP reductase